MKTRIRYKTQIVFNTCFVCLLIVSFTLLSCRDHSPHKIPKADIDTVYNSGSGVQVIPLDSEKIHTLTNLGMLWGFLKYYHASVNKGNFNMDAELFRILPKILATHSTEEANKVMELWVNHFGVPDTCKNGQVITWPANTKLIPDYGCLFDKDNFPMSLINKLQFIRENRDTSQLHYYIETEFAGNPLFTHEIAYENNPYPDVGLRLLSLYRYWNMIQYFYPDRHLIGEDWDEVLTEFIPLFCDARDTLAYQLTCLQLIARIADTHAQLYGACAIDKLKGDYYIPFKAAFIENKLVVTGYYSDSMAVMKQLAPGDIIEQIDGIPVDSLVKKYVPLTPASNYPTQLRDLASSSGWLFRGRVPDIHLQIKRYEMVLNVVVHRSKDKINNYSEQYLKLPSIIEGNIGYIFPATLNSNTIDSLKIKFKDTKGIIIDMRCYPNTFMPYTYGAWLKPLRSPFVVATRLSIRLPGWFGAIDTFYNGSDTGSHYNGKLAIIVNQETFSQAEFTTMALSTVPGAIVIGDTTAGADGNVSGIGLPGGLATQISGLGELYPNGAESQRIGVKIDNVIKPTIKGIQERRDEPLEYAIKLMSKNY